MPLGERSSCSPVKGRSGWGWRPNCWTRHRLSPSHIDECAPAVFADLVDWSLLDVLPGTDRVRPASTGSTVVTGPVRRDGSLAPLWRDRRRSGRSARPLAR